MGTNEESKITTVNEKATFIFSDDKMEGYITFTKPEGDGKKIAPDVVKKEIMANNIVFGLDEELINKIAEGPRDYDEKYLIAKGEKPVNGEDGRLEYFFNVKKKTLAPKLNEDGTVDFRNLGLIETIDEGKPLAKIIDPTDGLQGTNVFGKPVPSVPGKPAPKLPKGKNTKQSSDGKELIAERSGQIVMSGSSISVSELLEIKQDVDNSTGNIDFNGSIVINGNIRQGFRVSAVGNIEVKGLIEGAEVTCEGNLIADKGIIGMNSSSIKVNGSISARTIQEANIEVGGDIISNAIMHSHVRCNGRIVLAGKGLLVGGDVFCREAVTVNIIGSSLGTHTEIKTGIEPRLLENYKELVNEFKTIQKQAEDITKELAVMGKPENVNAMPEYKKKSYIKTLYEAKSVQDKFKAKRIEVSNARSELEAFKHSGKILVNTAVYPGVNVQIGNAVISIRDQLPKCRLVNEDGRVKITHI